jgi:hypothetical protein
MIRDSLRQVNSLGRPGTPEAMAVVSAVEVTGVIESETNIVLTGFPVISQLFLQTLENHLG